MPNLTTKKLRRSPTEVANPASAPAPEVTVAWGGLGLDSLALSLAQTHHEKIIWKRLAASISASLEDQAVAFVQKTSSGWSFLSVDGLHDELRQAMERQDPRCPFLEHPEVHIENLPATLTAFPDAGPLYEFIEHYWGWRLACEGVDPIYLMVFGTEQEAPSELAKNAARLSGYVCTHISSQKNRQQLISDLSAEIQGLRISAGAALHRRLEQWMARDDGAK